MRARIWGCRGSLATPGPDTIGYGGNTPCVEVRADDETIVVLDAGTGIRLLGQRLANRPSCVIHLLLTHLHLDHVEGLRFFVPLWKPDTRLHVWGPRSQRWSLRERIARYFSPPFFPIELRDVPSSVSFHDVPDHEWQIGSLRVTAGAVSHPGPTVGFRLEQGGGSLAYIPDHEPVVGGGLDDYAADWISGLPLASGADVLLHDAQYSEAEYPERVGWGHSSVAAAAAFARAAGVGQLVLFHHDPLHGDAELELLEDRARELWDGIGGRPPTLAREGMEILFGGGRAQAEAGRVSR